MRVVLLALLIFIATPVWAVWVEVSKGDTATTYIDPASIRTNGNIRKVWQIFDLMARSSYGVLSFRMLAEYDCKGERYRFLSQSGHADHMAKGSALSVDDRAGEWAYIAPNTVASDHLHFVCTK